MQLFADPLHDEFASWALGYLGSGGADLGEIVAIADSMSGSPGATTQPADHGAFYDAWMASVRRHEEAAAAASEAGHAATALGHWLRAATGAGVAYHPLYGSAVDPRLRAAPPANFCNPLTMPAPASRSR